MKALYVLEFGNSFGGELSERPPVHRPALRRQAQLREEILDLRTASEGSEEAGEMR